MCVSVRACRVRATVPRRAPPPGRRHLLEVDPKKRYTPAQVLAHPWVKNAYDENIPSQARLPPSVIRSLQEEELPLVGWEASCLPFWHCVCGFFWK